MAEVLETSARVPPGAHCVSFHASQSEAADHAAGFLAGAPRGQSASYWVAQVGLLPLYRDRVGAIDPEHVRSVRVLAGPQVHRLNQRLRPVEEITSFLERHPDGVTGGAETITWYWTADDIRDYLEYEQWFQLQPRARSRFLCPYDLRRVPADDAVAILRELVDHHSHLVLSRDPAEPVRLLQVLLFPNAEALPAGMIRELEWAVDGGYAIVGDHTRSVTATLAGRELLDRWRRD